MYNIYIRYKILEFEGSVALPVFILSLIIELVRR